MVRYFTGLGIAGILTGLGRVRFFTGRSIDRVMTGLGRARFMSRIGRTSLLAGFARTWWLKWLSWRSVVILETPGQKCENI